MGSLIEHWFDNAIDVLNWARDRNNAGCNIYVCWGHFRGESRTKEDLIATGAFVADWDGNAPILVNGIQPTMRVETSPGREQHVYMFPSGGTTRAEAEPAFRRLADSLPGCDRVTSNCVGLWRLPGTTNWPDAKKRAAGRTPCLSVLRDCSAAEIPLEKLYPETPKPILDWPHRRGGQPLPPVLERRLAADCEIGERSEKLYGLEMALAELGWGADDIFDRLRGTAYNKFADDNHLRADIERVILDALDDGRLKAPVRSGRLHYVKFNDVALQTTPRWLVKGLIDQGTLSVVYGPPGSGKSFVVLNMALHVALGRDWFGLRVKQAAVVYVIAEGGRGMPNRVEAFRKHHNLTGVDVPFAFVPCTVDLRDPAADTEPLIALIKQVAEDFGSPVGWIIVDTLSRALNGGNENASEDMTALIGNADRIREDTNAHVLFVHHPPQGENKPRGHTSLIGAVDTAISLKDGRVQTVKQRDIETIEPLGFKLQVVDLGVDDEGERLASCVVVPAVVQATNRERVAPEQVLAVLRGIGKPVISRRECKEKLIQEGIIKGEQSAAQRQQFKRYLDELLEAGSITADKDKISLKQPAL